MKIKHLLIGMLAMSAAVACQEELPVEEPALEVSTATVSVAATAGEATFDVTSNQSWVATADADWVSMEPASGAASEKAVTVKVTAEDNEATEARTATVTVKAGKLTKTVTVNQAAGEAVGPGEDPGDEPEVEAPTYILVGEAVGGWDVDNNGVVLTLKDGYYEAKGVAVTAKKGMHFTKNNSWEGNVKGLHGLIAPNEIGEVGNNDISLTEGGNYDVYLTEALDKFYFMTEGKLPSEAVEHVEIAVVWGVCGAIEGNAWGASVDVVLAADGEWLAAKGVAFTEVNFKVRGNNSWADDVKWGAAEKDQVCELNKAIAVSTCTEFKAANPTASDNPNVYVATDAGTYDVYFSPEKKEVWVMTPGYKPGDEVPVTPGPEQPEPETSTWALVGSFNGWNAAGSTAFLSVLDADYFVYYGFEAGANTEFKFVKDGKWASQGGAEIGGAIGIAEPNTIQTAGGKNIVIAEAGKYDIYLAADLSKFYVMTEGKLPAEATEPAPVETTYTVVGTLNGINWSNNAPEGLMTKDGAYYVAKNVPFVTAKTLYGGADQFEFKVVETGTWNGYGVAGGTAAASANTEIVLQENGENIPVVAPEGAYDVYFDKENAKLWVMTAGLKPGETPVEPEPVDVDIDGKQWLFTWNAMYGASCVIDLGVTEPGVAILAYDMGVLDPSYAGIVYPYMIGTYTVTKTDGTSGVVTLNDILSEMTVDIPYSNATETSVHFATAAFLEEDVDCTLATSKVEINMESAEYLEDGEYWIIADGNVATPLTSSYGYLKTASAINGKSYAANAFTFTMVEAGVYTIQDVNGKYYFQKGTYDSFNVSDNLGTDDGYYWEVYDTGNGQFVIMNLGVAKFVQYDTSYSSYGSYAEEKGILPTLVPADDPIAVPEPEPLPDGAGRADFETLTRSSSYGAATSTAGWVLTNCAVQEGGEKDANPVYVLLGKVEGTETWAKAACMNGKTAAVGTIESPELTGGCGTLSFNYANIFSESNGVDFKVEIIQDGTVVKTIRIDENSVTKMTKYTYSEEVNVSGTFRIKFTNNCPSNNASSNKDRVSIWNLMWTACN